MSFGFESWRCVRFSSRRANFVAGTNLVAGFQFSARAGFHSGKCASVAVLPGPTPDRTLTLQTLLAREKPETPAAKEAAASFSAMVLQAVRDEDYDIGFKIQAGLASGGNTAFVFGRNEPTLQHYHSWVARLAAQD